MGEVRYEMQPSSLPFTVDKSGKILVQSLLDREKQSVPSSLSLSLIPPPPLSDQYIASFYSLMQQGELILSLQSQSLSMISMIMPRYSEEVMKE